MYLDALADALKASQSLQHDSEPSKKAWVEDHRNALGYVQKISKLVWSLQAGPRPLPLPTERVPLLLLKRVGDVAIKALPAHEGSFRC